MTADDILAALMTGEQGQGAVPNWIARAATIVCPPVVLPGRVAQYYETTAVNFFPEVTIRIPAPGTTRRGKLALQRRRMDLVGFVQPHYKSFEPFAVGVEIKVDYHDLMGDTKLIHYLGYVHLFYLAVPANLEEAARRKLAPLDKAGLLVVEDSGRVEMAIKPQVDDPIALRLEALYAELLLRPFKRAKKDCKKFLEFERGGQ